MWALFVIVLSRKWHQNILLFPWVLPIEYFARIIASIGKWLLSKKHKTGANIAGYILNWNFTIWTHLMHITLHIDNYKWVYLPNCYQTQWNNFHHLFQLLVPIVAIKDIIIIGITYYHHEKVNVNIILPIKITFNHST